MYGPGCSRETANAVGQYRVADCVLAPYARSQRKPKEYRMPNTDPNILAVVQSFVRQVTAAVEASAVARVQAALAAAFGTPAKRGPGRPKKALAPATARPVARRKARKVSPKQARARKLQGAYLGALRALGAGDRVKVKALAKSKGVPEALKLAASLRKPKK